MQYRDLHLVFALGTEIRGYSRLAEILKQVSHDSVNRFLLRERYEARDLFETLKPYFNLVGGVLSVDDTVIEKTYSDVNQAELIDYYWSGKYHKTIKGINLITLYHCDIQGNTLPVNSFLINLDAVRSKLGRHN